MTSARGAHEGAPGSRCRRYYRAERCEQRFEVIFAVARYVQRVPEAFVPNSAVRMCAPQLRKTTSSLPFRRLN